jgi:hypothetical protein
MIKELLDGIMMFVKKIDESKNLTKFILFFYSFVFDRTMDQFLNRFTQQYDDMSISSDENDKKNRILFHFISFSNLCLSLQIIISRNLKSFQNSTIYFHISMIKLLSLILKYTMVISTQLFTNFLTKFDLVQ